MSRTVSTSEHPWSDYLWKTISKLKGNNEETRNITVTQLQNYVGSQSRLLSQETFTSFIQDLNNHIFELVNSSSGSDQIAGIIFISALIDVEYEETVNKTSRLANFLRIVLSTNDVPALHMASKALGSLARSSGILTAECVEFEIKRALRWLQADRKLAACLVIKELTINSPTVAYVHVQTFIELVWDAFNDSKLKIREVAEETLNVVLQLTSTRENSQHFKWYNHLYQGVEAHIKQETADSIHGAFLVIGGLLRYSGEFMNSKFRDVCEIILKNREHREKIIRRTVIGLLPQLALFSPYIFVKNYLAISTNYLLKMLRSPTERPLAFLALGELAGAIGDSIMSFIEQIINAIKLGLTSKSKYGFCPEALKCISMFSSALGTDPSLMQYMNGLLPMMFSQGISPILVEALIELSETMPNILPLIQQRLLDLISHILANKPFTPSGTPANFRRPGGFQSSSNFQQLSGTEQDSAVIALALHTLGTFEFSKLDLLEFCRECLLKYLEDELPLIRKEASLTIAKLIVPPGSMAPIRGHSSLIIGEVLQKLLVVGIADPDTNIRRTVLASLLPKFDNHLAQAENLRSLFMALNDEEFEIRELAIVIIGRLTKRNPAYVMPSLRKTLIQLLTELEYSCHSRNKEESAALLGHLIRSSDLLIKPYVEPILRALLPKLSSSSPRVASCVLSVFGELSIVAVHSMMPYIDELLQAIIAALYDQSSSAKREVALHALGQLARSTGYVIDPLLNYPELFDIILNSIATVRSGPFHRELLKVFGILGALDPYRHKTNTARIKQGQGTGGQSSSKAEGSSFNSPNQIEALPQVASTSEDYYPTVAITALLRILRDNTLSSHHVNVIHSVMFIFKSLGLKGIPFLPYIMPPFLHVMNASEPGLRDVLFTQLCTLVSIVKQHIRDYLVDIFAIIKNFWDTPLLPQIISLVEEISMAMWDEFKVYLPHLIPQMLNILLTDRSSKRVNTIKVLSALEIFGTNLDDYLHLVIPAVVRLFEAEDTLPSIRTAAIQTLSRLCKLLNVSDFASRIIHPTVRVLNQGSNVNECMETLCILIQQLGSDYAIFIPMLHKVLSRHRIQHDDYNNLVSRLLKRQPLEISPSEQIDMEKGLQLTSSGTGQPQAQSNLEMPSVKKLKVNEENLRQAWETSSQRTTKEDWFEWMRKFNVELLRESPSPSLRSCLSLSQDYHPLLRELFNYAFLSCWNELHENAQEELMKCLETALLSPSIPHEILQNLLNLAEFMEHDEKPLPIDQLGSLAQKCHAYAKALHYKEAEFQQAPSSENIIEELISINNNLQQPEAAIGILLFAQQNHNVQLQEAWYEKLGRWEDAHKAYEAKRQEDLQNQNLMLGLMRCLNALGEWEQLFDLSQQVWRDTDEDDEVHSAMAPLAAASAWNMGQWKIMREYVGGMEADSVSASFFRAILCVHNDQFEEAQLFIDNTRDLLEAELTVLVSESYDRAYNIVVKVQQLSELEEVIEYKQSTHLPERQTMIRNTWVKRILGCQRDIDTWQRILAIHSLVVPPNEIIHLWLKFADICRKNGRARLTQHTLSKLIGEDVTKLSELELFNSNHRVAFSYLKLLWSEAESDNKQKVFEQLRDFSEKITDTHDLYLRGRVFLKLGEWQLSLVSLEESLDEKSIPQILSSFKAATTTNTNWHKAWHMWALTNFEVATHYDMKGVKRDFLLQYILSSIRGFFRSIALGPEQSLQDSLRVLTLLFKYGEQKEVEAALLEGFRTVSIDTWLQVIPQIIARVHSPIHAIRRLTHELLTSIGKHHPQALVYPVTVTSKAQSVVRLAAARKIIDSMRKHSPVLVEQALLVSQELIRVAILWYEMWHEGLEEASRMYFGEQNVQAMLQTLAPLHKILENGPETLREVSFQQAFARDLQEAHEWCKKYLRSGKSSDLSQAWDLYYHVFRRINKQLSQLTVLELQYVSPKLQNAKDLELAVPGTYQSTGKVVKIKSFQQSLNVITSKQRPRKLSIFGSNGKEYKFLLKGHEDLRQDERVMQLFGLVNNLLQNNSDTSKSHLSIGRYAVIPLSPNSGLIGWVPHSDTFHQLIHDYRDSRKMLLNIEHRLMLQMSPDYDNLTLLQKVEVFKFALETCDGADLERLLWLKSPNAEVWLERRTNYTRSLAVMSMVGYILGLGDRHPSNLMLDRYSGKVVHIDFGDCFDVAMHRERYPEKIPFRLTRMLVNAMEVSQIEGNFRFTCEKVMRVLRENKDSLMAALEAFVYDPLINWRLLTPNSPDNTKTPNPDDTIAAVSAQKAPVVTSSSKTPNYHATSTHRVENIEEREDEDFKAEVLNERALNVIRRVNKKLTGRDFSADILDVPKQVDLLIKQATSHENLCQCYIGWCPFW